MSAVGVIVLSLLPAVAAICLIIRAIYARATAESRANRLLCLKLNQAADGDIGAAEALAAINDYEIVLEEQVRNAAISAELAEELRLGLVRPRAGLERQARNEQIEAGIDGVAMEMFSALRHEAELALAASHPMTIESLMPIHGNDDQRERVLRGMAEADDQRATSCSERFMACETGSCIPTRPSRHCGRSQTPASVCNEKSKLAF